MHKSRLVAAAALLAALVVSAPAFGSPIVLTYGAIVTSNRGNETDEVFPPGTRVTVDVLVDSESLLTGALLPATGLADTAGVGAMTLPIGRAGSSELMGVPGASARVFSFRGDGPFFDADGNPASDNVWQWTTAILYLPPLDDLDSLLALTLADVNDLIAAFGGMRLMQFIHEVGNGAAAEYAFTTELYDFSITSVAAPEPSTLTFVGLGLAAWARQRTRPRS